jgi:nucleoside-diphosphate-sugar epimerase
VVRSVSRAEPDVVLHELTALSGLGSNLRNFDKQFAETNRLRTEALDILLAAARSAGARRFIAQSFCGWPYMREGGPVKTEDDPLDPHPPAKQLRSFAAIRHLEDTVSSQTAIEGLVLRYGGLYGPGTSLAEGAEHAELVRQRKFPIVGEGQGIWSFIHIDDAAAATLAALDHGRPGIYNVVDDQPAPVKEWLPYLASVLGAKPPRRVPVWLGHLAAGEVGVSMMTQIRGGSNAKAKRELGWSPKYPTYREGFKHGLAEQVGGGAGAHSAAAPSRAA